MKFFFEKIRLVFDIENWLWKYNFSTFWQTVITRRNFLKIFPWLHVDSCPKSLLLRTHHFWNSTTELILLPLPSFTLQNQSKTVVLPVLPPMAHLLLSDLLARNYTSKSKYVTAASITDKRTDVWSRDFIIWKINSGCGLGWTVK